MMTWKHICWISLASFHLLVAGLHAAHLKEWFNGKYWLLTQVEAYADFTGAGNIYSFFAPHVGNEIGVVYTIADAGSHQKVVRLEETNTECNRRIQTVYNFFSLDEAQSLLAKSCASYMMRQYPEGEMVRITVISKEIPEMSAFRQGATPKWGPVLVKNYKRKNS
jgi:hypothetical protein